MAQQEATISGILQQLAQQYNASISERALCERVLEQRPSQAKDPFASIRDKLRWDAAHVGWVRLGAGEVIPLRIVREGLTFRLIPDDQEYRDEQILRLRLLPFITPYDTEIRLEDAAGRPVSLRTEKLRDPSFAATNAALDLGGWFRRSGFQLGDSIIITIRSHAPLVLRLEHEPAAAFRADDVLRQEHEFIEQVAKAVGNSRTNLSTAEDLILPIIARAEWRTGYPSRPWQMLVDADPRLRLVDELFVASRNFRRPIDSLRDARAGLNRDDEDARLLEQITALQAQMIARRRSDAEEGLWDGIAPRSSTARVVFDIQAGTSTVIFLEPIDTRYDYSDKIEQNLEQGGYEDADWGDDFDDDDDFDDFDDFDSLDIDGLTEIDDLQEFMEENPQLAEAAQKLMAALTPEEIGRLQSTDSTEEAQQILANRLHRMLPSDPSLFATFAPYTADVNELSQNDMLDGSGYTGSNGANGNGLSNDVAETGHDLLESDWDPQVSDWDDLSAAQISGDAAASLAALEQSNELMERFQQYLRAQGKSNATATSRAGDLWAYADFLANYYNRSLAEGDYATLDECMFFFYPRKVLNSTARSAREMCTSIKQFYGFLQATGGTDDQFAQAIWRRRDQVGRVIELYEQIDGDSQIFERLFAYLFAPYTA